MMSFRGSNTSMSNRAKYIRRRLVELACIAETRKLDSVEEAEERRLVEELVRIDLGESDA